MTSLSLLNKLSFYLSIILSMIFVVATLGEMYVFQSVQTTAAQEKDLQGEIAHAQQLNSFTEQLLRRLAFDSLKNPALAELLRKHKINVNVKNDTTLPAGTVPSAPASDKASANLPVSSPPLPPNSSPTPASQP